MTWGDTSEVRTPDHATCYAAVKARDGRFDGRFYTGVKTTGIFCRPSCPARTPKAANVTFFPHPASAVAAGFRPCMRCRPELTPHHTEWNRRADLTERALRAIESGAIDEIGVAGLANQLGVSERHLRREINAQLGTSPRQLAQLRRLRVARILLDQTQLPVTQVSWAAGFTSIRQFNDACKAAFGVPPSKLRRLPTPEGPAIDTPDSRCSPMSVGITLQSSGGTGWGFTHRYLAARAIPGLESVSSAETPESNNPILRFARSLPGCRVEVSGPANGDTLHLDFTGTDLRLLGRTIPVVRRVADLDTNLDPIRDHLRNDPWLAAILDAHQLPRLVGAFDGFEVGVRAIVGQQISVAGARTLLGRLLTLVSGAPGATHPEPTGFPSPEAVAAADLSALGMPGRRKATITALAQAAADGQLDLSPNADPEQLAADLVRLPGIGPWTAGYIVMRATSAPDGWPPGDLGLRRTLGIPAPELERRAHRWQPWRAYAAMLLWSVPPVSSTSQELS